MSTMGERIRRARKASRLRQQALAAQLGVGRSVISNWENGINQPTGDRIIQLCDALSVSVAYLFDYYGGQDKALSPTDQEHLRKMRALDDDGRNVVEAVLKLEYARCTRPVERLQPPLSQLPTRQISYIPLAVSAGTGIMLNDAQTEQIVVELTPESKAADFVVQVSGNSMEPKYADGDLILVQQTNTVEQGELGIFGLNGEGYFKMLGAAELVSLNSDYLPIRIGATDDVYIFGRVIGKAHVIS